MTSTRVSVLQRFRRKLYVIFFHLKSSKLLLYENKYFLYLSVCIRPRNMSHTFLNKMKRNINGSYPVYSFSAFCTVQCTLMILHSGPLAQISSFRHSTLCLYDVCKQKTQCPVANMLLPTQTKYFPDVLYTCIYLLGLFSYYSWLCVYQICSDT